MRRLVADQGRIDLSRDWEEATIDVAPRFETGDERYQWLNIVQAVGRGRIAGDGLRYEWYELR